MVKATDYSSLNSTPQLQCAGDEPSTRRELANAIRIGRQINWHGKDGIPAWVHWQLSPLNKVYRPFVVVSDVTICVLTHSTLSHGLREILATCPKQPFVVGINGDAVSTGVKSVRIPWLGHGLSRNHLLAHVTTPYVLFTVDDATLFPDTLVRLRQTLESCAADAVVARQIPWPDASPIVRRRISRWTPYHSSPYQIEQCDNVATIYRTAQLKENPFATVPIAEDALWSEGKTIYCDPLGLVLHSHDRNPRSLFWREYCIFRQLESHKALTGSEVYRSGLSALRAHGVGEALSAFAESLGAYWAHR